MAFSIGGREYYEPSREAVVMMVNTIHNMATDWIGNKGKMPKYLFLNRDDFYEGEDLITAALWQYARKWEHVIEPIWDPEIPRGMMTMLSEDEYVHKREVVHCLKRMKENPELLPVF